MSFGPSAPTTVSISQVTTEVEFVARSEALESALSEGDFSEYCSVKMDNASSQQEKDIWEFMKVSVCVLRCACACACVQVKYTYHMYVHTYVRTVHTYIRI